MAKARPANEDLGQPLQFDPTFTGPLKRRSCTDVICLLLFLVFIGCWAGIGLYAILNGDPNILLVPKDSQGARCGLDSHVQSKPYLFFFDLTRCIGPDVPFTGCPTPQVCVEECPTITFLSNTASSDELQKNIICTYDVKPTTEEEAKSFIEGGHCAAWYLPSSSVQKRCLPTSDAINNLGDEFQNIINSTDIISAIQNIKLLAQAQEVGLNIVQDIINSWWHILIGLGIALLICIIYIAVMRWIAAFMVWLSICGVIALLSFCVYFTAVKYKYYKNNSSATNSDSVIDKYLGNKNTWLSFLIISSVILGIIVLVLLFLRKRIVLAIALIKEGSKAVSSVTSSLFFPIVPWILQVGVVAYAVVVALYLATVGDPKYEIRNFNAASCICTGNASSYANNTECDPEVFKEYCKSETGLMCTEATCYFTGLSGHQYSIYLHVANVFGFFWTAFFVSAYGQMVLATIFATWYWTFHKKNLPFFAVTDAACTVLRYHIGTLAFGSLIIAICRMIRVCLEYIDHKLKKYDNEITKAILCCCKCFFWCLEKFLKFINRNAYIMCAIHGKNFCTSAKDAFGLLMRNIIRVFVLDKVTDFLFFLSKVLLCAGVGCIAYAIFVMNVTDLYQTELNYELVPVIVIIIATYFIATVFFSVYNMAVDTLFLCFLEDCERNDGSPDKPYFMSKQLMKVLGKRNKKLQ